MPEIPSQGTNWNLSSWLDRLGLKTGRQPDILPGVMPVQVLGDASALTSPLLPPLGWFGAFQLQELLEFSGLAIRSRAPGGSFVRTLRASSGSIINHWVWTVGEPEHVFTTPGVVTPLPAFNMGPDPCTAIVRTGSTLVPLSRDDHPTVTNSSDLSMFADEIYLAPGAEFYIEVNVVNAAGLWAVLVQDNPAMIPTG